VAQRTITLLEDGIDGDDADWTILFALDGVTDKIDLNDCNAGQDARRRGSVRWHGARRWSATRWGAAIALPARAPGLGRN